MSIKIAQFSTEKNLIPSVEFFKTTNLCASKLRIASMSKNTDRSNFLHYLSLKVAYFTKTNMTLFPFNLIKLVQDRYTFFFENE